MKANLTRNVSSKKMDPFVLIYTKNMKKKESEKYSEVCKDGHLNPVWYTKFDLILTKD